MRSRGFSTSYACFEDQKNPLLANYVLKNLPQIFKDYVKVEVKY
jgi:hypothetical protein